MVAKGGQQRSLAISVGDWLTAVAGDKVEIAWRRSPKVVIVDDG